MPTLVYLPFINSKSSFIFFRELNERTLNTNEAVTNKICTCQKYIVIISFSYKWQDFSQRYLSNSTGGSQTFSKKYFSIYICWYIHSALALIYILYIFWIWWILYLLVRYEILHIRSLNLKGYMCQCSVHI